MQAESKQNWKSVVKSLAAYMLQSALEECHQPMQKTPSIQNAALCLSQSEWQSTGCTRRDCTSLRPNPSFEEDRVDDGNKLQPTPIEAALEAW